MLYVGTEDGKLLVIDLRALEKGPRIITISETGEKIASMCIQASRSHFSLRRLLSSRYPVTEET